MKKKKEMFSEQINRISLRVNLMEASNRVDSVTYDEDRPETKQDELKVYHCH